jgi:DNA-binding NtrC family response regulator
MQNQKHRLRYLRMRKLLILSPEPLDADLAEVLQRNNWQLAQTHDTDQARSLAEANEFSVGLVILPGETDNGVLDEYEAVMRHLPQIKWTAAIARSQLESKRVKSLIVDRLYDYQSHPLDPARLSFALGHAYGMAQIEKELRGQTEPDMRSRTREDLQLEGATKRGSIVPLQTARNQAERAALESSLHQTGWQMSKTAKRLKISRMTLYRLVEKHGLTRNH